MRIGRVMLDTANMTPEDITVLIDELRKIRKRKQEAESLQLRMRELLADAEAAHFSFVDTNSGMVLDNNTITHLNCMITNKVLRHLI